VLLTFSTDKNQSELVNEKFHEKIECKDFVHKCYIESARSIYNNPELFWHKYPTIEIKRNQREICELIKVAIKEAIRKMLPMKLILKEYLKNEYVKETHDVSKNMSDSQYMNVKAMVNRDLYGKGFVKPGESLLEDDYDGKNGPTGPNEDIHNMVNQNDNQPIDPHGDTKQNAFEQLNTNLTPHPTQPKQTIHGGHSKTPRNTFDGLYKEINELNDELHDIENDMADSDEQPNPNTGGHINHEINNYLKNSDEQNLKEIDTDKNRISETDKSQYFAKYNI